MATKSTRKKIHVWSNASGTYFASAAQNGHQIYKKKDTCLIERFMNIFCKRSTKWPSNLQGKRYMFDLALQGHILLAQHKMATKSTRKKIRVWSSASGTYFASAAQNSYQIYKKSFFFLTLLIEFLFTWKQKKRNDKIFYSGLAYIVLNTQILSVISFIPYKNRFKKLHSTKQLVFEPLSFYLINKNTAGEKSKSEGKSSGKFQCINALELSN